MCHEHANLRTLDPFRIFLSLCFYKRLNLCNIVELSLHVNRIKWNRQVYSIKWHKHIHASSWLNNSIYSKYILLTINEDGLFIIIRFPY